MKGRFIFFVLTLCFINVQSYYYGQREIYLPDGSIVYTEGNNCTKQGFMCDDCKTVVFCFQLPTGEWIKEEMQQCNDKETCLTSTATCQTAPNPECDSNVIDYKFVCHQPGLFPNAFDCTKYHLCTLLPNGSIDPESIEHQCKTGFAFDPLTTLCRKNITESCSTLKPCTVIGENGPIGDHPSLYYVCLPTTIEGIKVPFPQYFYCADDFVYDGKECVDPKLADLINGKCKKVGKFYVPGDCRNFNECTKAGDSPTLNSCTVGNKFDRRKSECKPFTCDP